MQLLTTRIHPHTALMSPSLIFAVLLAVCGVRFCNVEFALLAVRAASSSSGSGGGGGCTVVQRAHIDS